MKFDRNLDQSLKDLDNDIKWTKDRQQHVRNNLINKIQQNNMTHMPKKRGSKILPAISVMFVIAIMTIIALSGIGTENISLNDTNNQRISGNKGDKPSQDTSINNNELNINEHDHEDFDHPETTEPTVPFKNEEELDELSKPNDTPESDSQDDLLTQAQIMEVIKGQMNSDLTYRLPTEINLPEGKHLTAVTSSNPNSYEVIFYQHNEPIPINNKLLFSEDNPAEVVARVEAKRYETQEEADQAITYQNFDESMGKPIKLREGLTGYQNTDDESVSINWNVGRWALTIHENAGNNDRSESLAKEVITYLDEYMLPAPQQHGYAYLEANQGNSRIIWEKETIVYTIDQINDPLQALEIAVKFE